MLVDVSPVFDALDVPVAAVPVSATPGRHDGIGISSVQPSFIALQMLQCVYPRSTQVFAPA
ncbi:MAG: hypothetical protein IAG13_24505 [Deltaproteobacteria bacterium]|nr:hypothetical protein [Nannocystaceae bacterium]